jgi:hypothetical protein
LLLLLGRSGLTLALFVLGGWDCGFTHCHGCIDFHWSENSESE